MKKWGVGLLAAAVLFAAAPQYPVQAASVQVPESVFYWVQSTSRQNYYFNKEQMCYGVDSNGNIDLNTLIVPTLHTYDDVQKQDVVDKRRWKTMSLDGYDKLVGCAEYLSFNLTDKTVAVTQHDDLDDTWTALSSTHDGTPMKICGRSDKDVDAKFYRAILLYAQEHQDELLARTKGNLSKADQKQLKNGTDPLHLLLKQGAAVSSVTKDAGKTTGRTRAVRTGAEDGRAK